MVQNCQGVDLTGEDRNAWFKDFRVDGEENLRKRAHFISFIINTQREKKSAASLRSVVKETVKKVFEDQKTETATMSKAKQDFTDNLLTDLGTLEGTITSLRLGHSRDNLSYIA